MMNINGKFFEQQAARPLECAVSLANGQVFVYLSNPDSLVVWTMRQISHAAFDGEAVTLTSGSAPSQQVVCSGAVAADIYAAWLERDVPKQEKKSFFTLKVLALIAVAGLIITGLVFYILNSVMPAIAERSSSWVPVELEISMGDKMAEGFILQAKQDEKNDSINHYLGQFVSHLDLGTKYPIRVRVISSDEINAFALPGGNIFIYSGLLQKMESPEELVALLGHEVSHVTKRHSLKSMMSSAAGGMLLSAFFGDMGGVSSWIVSKAGEFRQLEYSRELESEADIAGLEIIKLNKVDPDGMLKLLRLLQAEGGKTPELMKYLSTHPETEERMRIVRSSASYDSHVEANDSLKRTFGQIKLWASQK